MCPAPRQYYVTLLVLGTLALLAGCQTEREREEARFDGKAAEVEAGTRDFIDFYDIQNPDELLRKHAGLKGLKAMWFSTTPLSGSGVAEIPNYPDLEELVIYELYREPLRDSWLETLKACPKLKSLEITEGGPPQFSVAKVLELPHLRQLSIEVSKGPGVDEWISESIRTLHNPHELEKIGFGGEFYSHREELAELRKAVPNCRMVFTTRNGTEYEIPLDP